MYCTADSAPQLVAMSRGGSTGLGFMLLLRAALVMRDILDRFKRSPFGAQAFAECFYSCL